MGKHIQSLKETSVHTLNITFFFTPQGLANLSEAKTGPDTEVNAVQSSWQDATCEKLFCQGS